MRLIFLSGKYLVFFFKYVILSCQRQKQGDHTKHGVICLKNTPCLSPPILPSFSIHLMHLTNATHFCLSVCRFMRNEGTIIAVIRSVL